MNSKSKKVDGPSFKSTSKAIENIHGMPWLKNKHPALNSSEARRTADKDGRIISQKKTNEDYFPGTKDEKKAKKKKEKKAKPVLTLNELENLVSLTQQQNDVKDPDFEEQTELNPLSDTENATNTTNNTVWSTASSTVDKLFPDVQSVRIDRLQEDKMLLEAIAESIVTVQLEKFKRHSPGKEDNWETLYGDSDDEEGWNNVKRNLPTALETTNSSGEESSGQRRSRGDSYKDISKSGILKNKLEKVERFSTQITELDFSFKTFSERKKDDVKSTRSVSFNETIDVKVCSNESSDNDEPCKNLIDNNEQGGPIIDKYGRVDGYSERRLFMGKGARIKEQQYLQNKCSLGNGNTKLETNLQLVAIIEPRKPEVTALLDKPGHQKFKSDSQATGIAESKKLEVTALLDKPRHQFKSDLQATGITETKKPEVTALLDKPRHQFKSDSQATGITETKKPEVTALLDKPRHQFKSDLQATGITETKKPEVTALLDKPGHQKFKSDLRATGITETEKSVICVKNLQQQKTKNANPEEQKTKNSTDAKNYNRKPKTQNGINKSHEKPSEMKELKSIERRTAPMRRPHVFASNTNGPARKKEPLNDRKNKSGIRRNDSEHKKPKNDVKVTSILDEANSSLRKEEINEKRDVEYLRGSIQQEDMVLQNLNVFLNTDNNFSEQQISDNESESVDRCLVPTLVMEHEYAPNVNQTDFQYANNISAMSDLKFQTGAIQNLLLAGASFSDLSCDAQDLMLRNLDPQNNFIDHSSRQNIVPTQYQPLNNNQNFQPDCTRNWDRGGYFGNSGRCDVPRFMECGEAFLSNTTREDSRLTTFCDRVQPYEKAENYRGRYSTPQVPPGMIRKLRLPSGFTKKESTQSHNTDETQRQEISSGQHNVQTNPSSSNAQRNYHTSQNGFECGEPNPNEYRRVPYPILGAAQSLPGKSNNFQSDESNSHRNPESERDAAKDQSPSQYSAELNPNNNYYYLNSSKPNTFSDLEDQGINNSLTAICQIPNECYSKPSNWQYHVNSMNAMLLSMNLMQNSQIRPPPGYPQPPTYQNKSSQEPPMHMPSLEQIPVYPVSHVLNAEENDVENSWPGNMNYNKTEKETGQSFDNGNVGRGRGRLSRQNLS